MADDRQPDDRRRMSPTSRILAVVVLVLVSLLTIVIVVGLADDKLDPTGTATMLGGVITGVAGALIWKRQDDDK